MKLEKINIHYYHHNGIIICYGLNGTELNEELHIVKTTGAELSINRKSGLYVVGDTNDNILMSDLKKSNFILPLFKHSDFSFNNSIINTNDSEINEFIFNHGRFWFAIQGIHDVVLFRKNYIDSNSWESVYPHKHFKKFILRLKYA